MHKPSRLSLESLHRSISDISFELSKELLIENNSKLLTVSEPEIQEAKCECCGMSEECTPDYIKKVRDEFLGKLICGLCAKAVQEETERKGGKELEEALKEHMSACSKFNSLGRTHPLLFQAEAMREILKKSSTTRAKSISPRAKGGQNKGGIARTSSSKQVECECCGLIEDCTPNYIAKVKDSFSGKWVCGLCSEAVKEKRKQISTSTNTSNVEEALKSHKDFCQSYNNTTRLNPKLSLTSAMRDIAKKSFVSRSTSCVKPKPKLTRTISCDPRINLDTK
ncbi:Protein of unknown function DUF1677, plant [Dillenia turbinata]|uniref:Uncharacterized protein n=1 Tax=Dillenia turbinata TaxID=194707 RepID=A0AAN8YX09_9MAGN